MVSFYKTNYWDDGCAHVYVCLAQSAGAVEYVEFFSGEE